MEFYLLSNDKKYLFLLDYFFIHSLFHKFIYDNIPYSHECTYELNIEQFTNSD